MTVGATAFTHTPKRAHRAARLRVRASTTARHSPIVRSSVRFRKVMPGDCLSVRYTRRSRAVWWIVTIPTDST
jgi:hypothetical protein